MTTMVICTDKTGTSTAGAMAVTGLSLDEREITIDGSGYEPVGRFLEGGKGTRAGWGCPDSRRADDRGTREPCRPRL